MKINFANIWYVCKRELKGYFTSPLAYVFIVIFLVLSGFFTFNEWIGRFFVYKEANLSMTFFSFHPWFYLLLVPAVAMRLWSEEYKSGTVELLFTLPISVSEAVTGKFLAAWTILAVSLALTWPAVYTVGVLGSPDYGMIMTGYLASFLLSGSFLAIGSFTSSMTKNQVVSFILSFVICLFFILVSHPSVTSFFRDRLNAPVWIVDIVARCGIFEHFENMKKGLIDLRDIIYFSSLIAVSLFATGITLYSKRTSI